MVKIDFTTIDDAEEYTPIPHDKYLCEIDEVEKEFTQKGDEMYRLRHNVLEGDYANRRIFDNLVFSDAAKKRVKLVCSRLGIDVSGEVELTPEMFIGRKCYLTVVIKEYQDHEGNTKFRNEVPYAGYEQVEETKEEEESRDVNIKDEEIPF